MTNSDKELNQAHIYSKLKEKSTDELYEIWKANDTEEWTPEALLIARGILQDRTSDEPSENEFDEPKEIDTYTNLDAVSTVATLANVLSWVFLVYTVITLVTGIFRATNESNGFKAILLMGENLLSPLVGIVLFVFLRAISHSIYLFMDIEDNTRRAAKALEIQK